jgi:HK97 family phage major capsid protein
MTEAEQERADTLDGHIKAVDQKIKHKQREQEMVARMAQSHVTASNAEQREIDSVNYKYSLSRAVNAVRNQRSLEGAELEWTQEAQREARAGGLQLSGHIGIPASALMRAGTADDFQATATGDGSGFVSTDVPGAIAALRAPTFAERLGCQVINAQGNLKLPRISEEADALIAGEVSAYGSANMEMDEVTMSPQRAASTTVYSKQLLVQGGPQVDAIIANDMRAALAERVDRKFIATAIAGAGNDKSPPASNDTANGATLALMESLVLEDGGDVTDTANCAFVLSPFAYGKLKAGALVANVNPTMIGSVLNGYSFYGTPFLGNTSSTQGKAIFANWNQSMLLAYFGGIDILVDPFTEAGTGQVRLHATRFFDAAVRQAGALCKHTKLA